ncbi:unnamed protein product, partial [Didymodactylos carnosus]
MAAFPKMYFDKFKPMSKPTENAFSLDKLQISSVDELSNVYTTLVQELNNKRVTVNEICQRLIAESDEIVADTSVIDHVLYTLLIPNTLSDILQKWHEQQHLTDDESTLFHNVSLLLLKLISYSTDDSKKINKISTWLVNKPFIESIAVNIKDIAEKGAHFSDRNLEHLDTILEALTDFQHEQKPIMNNPIMLQLLESIVDCLSSTYYSDTFLKLRPDVKQFNESEQFLLITCAHYFNKYSGSRRQELIDKLLSKKLQIYLQIYDKFLPSIAQWQNSLILAFYYITNFLAFASTKRENVDAYTEKIVDNVILILSAPILIQKISSISINPETMLLLAAIQIIRALTA